MSEEVEKKCLGPLGCGPNDTRISECCIMNGGFHTESIELPKGPFTFKDPDGRGFVHVPRRK